MDKNTLLQGIEDYQGFNDYWIFALAKTHPARQSWGFQKEQGCPSLWGGGRHKIVTAATATTPEAWLLRMGPVLGVWKDRQASTAAAKHLVNHDGCFNL